MLTNNFSTSDNAWCTNPQLCNICYPKYYTIITHITLHLLHVYFKQYNHDEIFKMSVLLLCCTKVVAYLLYSLDSEMVPVTPLLHGKKKRITELFTSNGTVLTTSRKLLL